MSNVIINPYNFVSAIPFPNTYSLDFDGVDDYVDCGDVAVVDGASALTLSGWIKPANTTNTQMLVSKFTDLNNRTSIGISADVLYFNVSNGGGKYATVAFTDTGWNHIVMVFDGSGVGNTGRLKGYVNGVAQTLSYGGTIATTLADLGGNPVTIGFQNTGSGEYMEGNIDEVSIWSTALSSGNVTTLYNSGTPNNLNTALGTTPVNWYRCGDSGTFFNSNWEIPEQTKIDNWSSHSMEFDGTDDYIDCGTGIGDSLGDNYTGDLSLSMWFKADLTSGNDGLFTIGDFSSSIGEFTISVYLNEIYYRLNQGGWTRKVAFTDTSSWHHLLIIYKSGSEANSKMFLDGSEVGATSGSFPATSAMDFAGLKTIIGAYYTNAYGWDGNIDEVAVWSNDQTANAATIYNSGTPADLTSLSPLGYWRMGEGITNWNGTNWQLPDYSKNALYSQKSLDFDDVDDYIDCGTGLGDSLGTYTGDLSVSLWFKSNDTTTSQGFFNLGSFASSQGELKLNMATNLIFLSTSNLSYYTRFSFTDTTSWHHLLVVYEAGVGHVMYLDGVAQTLTTTGVIASSLSLTGLKTIIAGTFSTTYLFNGKMDDVAIWDTIIDANTAASIYNTGKPNDLTLAASYTAGSGVDKSGDLQGYWIFDDATFSTNWTIPDNSTNSNNGTSANMDEVDLEFNSPTNLNSGLSSGMAIDDKVNNAPDNINQGLSSGMVEGDRDTDVP